MKKVLRSGWRWAARKEGAAPGPVAYVPGEDVLLLSVAMPPMNAAARRAAVAFAVEDRIARPLDELHVILGPALPGPAGHWLVAVIARDRLAAHLATHRPKAGQRLLPDTLSLPVPDAGHWAARVFEGRVILRMADGTGMVTSTTMLPVLHAAAGKPGIVLFGGTLPDDVMPVTVSGGTGHFVPPSGPDLSAAVRVADPLGLPPLLRRVAAVAGLAALAHLALVSAKTVVLSRQLASHQASLHSALVKAGLPADGDVETTLTGALAQSQAPAPDGFLPLLNATATAMQSGAGLVTLRELRFSASEGKMAMIVQAPDLATLQAMESALSAQLRVDAGTATMADGLAEQELVVAP